MNELNIGLVGATGYAGQVLHALLMHHPCMAPIVLTAREPVPAALDEVRGCAAVALAIPEDATRTWVEALRTIGVRAIDLSGTHRLLDDVHYGIPELHGRPPDTVNLVANPGCYPTASLLALRPLLAAGAIESEPVAIVGLSGTSGAGKGLRDDLHFSEMHGNFFPYNVGVHRHVPEIERYLGTRVNFVTQLMPIVRGLMITAFVRPANGRSAAQLHETLAEFYEPHPYVTVLPEASPHLGVRHVVGSHQALVAVGPSDSSGVVPVFCSIDNLMRGAASQALHNLNLWLERPAFEGLPPPLPTPPSGVPGMNRMLP